MDSKLYIPLIIIGILGWYIFLKLLLIKPSMSQILVGFMWFILFIVILGLIVSLIKGTFKWTSIF